jgi:hypothetical protein
MWKRWRNNIRNINTNVRITVNETLVKQVVKLISLESEINSERKLMETATEKKVLNSITL